jgi:hypothetical protein
VPEFEFREPGRRRSWQWRGKPIHSAEFVDREGSEAVKKLEGGREALSNRRCSGVTAKDSPWQQGVTRIFTSAKRATAEEARL